MPTRPPPACAGILLRLFAVFSLLLALASCGGGSGAVQAEAETTVLVYVIATDLEEGGGEASANLAEMQSVAPNEKVNLVLATGGARKDGWRTLQRKRVLGSRIELLEDLGPRDMGQASTLQDFIEWGVKAYPAKRYMLVLWDHGGGPNAGVGPDSTTGSVLSLPMLTQAISNARAQTGAHFDLIGFDACLMASVEIAKALSPHANYMLASQELEPGGGWDWRAFMRELTADPAIDIEPFGKAVIDGYIAKQEKEEPNGQSTLSLTDLRRLGPVMEALDEIGGYLEERLQADPTQAWYDITMARARATAFLSPRLMTGVDLVDLLSFFSWSSLNLPAGQYEKLEAAMGEAVRYERHTAVYPQLSGLTMFMPQRTILKDSTIEAYSELDFSVPMQAFVGEYVKVGRNEDLVPRPRLDPLIKECETGICATVANFDSMVYGFVAKGVQQEGRQFIIATKPPSEITRDESDQLVIRDANADEGWFALGTDRKVPVVMIPDGERYAVDDPYRYMVPVVLQSKEDPDAVAGGLLFVRSDEEGVLRAYSFLPDMLNDSPTVARPDELPTDALVAPRLMEVDANGQASWIYDPSSFVDLGDDPVVHQNVTFTEGTNHIGVEDHRGYVILSQPPK